MMAAQRQELAPPAHPVFEVVLPLFDEFISTFYAQLQFPLVTIHTMWGIFSSLLSKLHDTVDRGTLDHIRLEFERTLELLDEDLELWYWQIQEDEPQDTEVDHKILEERHMDDGEELDM